MQNRRAFLRNMTLASASLTAWTPSVLGANERVVLALIGGHNRGKQIIRNAIAAGGVVKTVCDVDQAVLDEVCPMVEKWQGRRPGQARYFQSVLEDPDIDAVMVATPDHWHTHITLLACQSGKDVYIEKPLCQTIREGQLIRDAARKYNRIVQVGLQRRSGEFYHAAAEYVASGKLGKICLIKCWVAQVRPSIGNPPDTDPPPTVDYDTWLGPAPKRPFNPNRFHYKWRFFWDYGNAEIGNMGVHAFDLAMMAIQRMRGVENCLPTHIADNSGIFWLHDAKEIPDTQTTTYHYGDFLLVWELRSFARHLAPEGLTFGVAFYGSEGALLLGDKGWKVVDSKNRIVTSMGPTPIRHEKNFLDCVKSRKKPNCDVELGRLSTMLCHLGNISCHLKRDVRFDPKTETFGDDAEANALLTKTYRVKYPLPKV